MWINRKSDDLKRGGIAFKKAIEFSSEYVPIFLWLLLLLEKCVCIDNPFLWNFSNYLLNFVCMPLLFTYALGFLFFIDSYFPYLKVTLKTFICRRGGGIKCENAGYIGIKWNYLSVSWFDSFLSVKKNNPFEWKGCYFLLSYIM